MSKIQHPLNDVFNITDTYQDPNEVIEYTAPNELIPTHQEASTMQTDDEEDKEINKKIDDVYEKAMDAFQEQNGYIQVVEPRYAARNAEVAAQYLKIALDAASTKAKVKEGKRKTNGFIPFNNAQNMTQNIVVGDRNEILRMMREQNK